MKFSFIVFLLVVCWFLSDCLAMVYQPVERPSLIGQFLMSKQNIYYLQYLFLGTCSRLDFSQWYPILDQNLYTPSQTKRLEKTYPLQWHIPIEQIYGSTPLWVRLWHYGPLRFELGLYHEPRAETVNNIGLLVSRVFFQRFLFW